MFPVLNLEKLMASPKAGKRGDMDRLLHSPNSEDYFTWNFFQLLEREPASRWWPALLQLAGVNSIDPGDLPAVRLWQTVEAPRAYEAKSRERLRAAGNARCLDAKAVEGRSEIDITFEGRDYLVFVEAKLGSDISLSTTYDPDRNQIARNIDCVLERCGGRLPVFWMFVRDRAPGRAYVELMERYRDAAQLQRALPHREEDRLRGVSGRLALVAWADLLALVPAAGGSVEAELRRRAGPA